MFHAALFLILNVILGLHNEGDEEEVALCQG